MLKLTVNLQNTFAGSLYAECLKRNPDAARYFMLGADGKFNPAYATQHTQDSVTLRLPPQFLTRNYVVTQHEDASDDKMTLEMKDADWQAAEMVLSAQDLQQVVGKGTLADTINIDVGNNNRDDIDGIVRGMEAIRLDQWAFAHAVQDDDAKGEWYFVVSEHGFAAPIDHDTSWSWLTDDLHGTAILDTTGGYRYSNSLTIPLRTAEAIKRNGFNHHEPNNADRPPSPNNDNNNSTKKNSAGGRFKIRKDNRKFTR